MRAANGKNKIIPQRSLGKRSIILGALLFAATWFWGCSNDAKNPENEEYHETSTSGKAEILCDASIFALMQPAFRMFDSAYPNANVTFTSVSSREAMAKLLAGESRAVINARGYLRDEDSLMQVYDVKPHRTIPIAKDALVLYTAPEFPLDTLSLDQIKRALQSAQPTLLDDFPHLGSEPHFVMPEVNSSVYSNVVQMLCEGRAPQRPLTYVNDQNEVRSRVLQSPNTIGIGYLSFIAKDEDIKALRIGFTDSTGNHVRPRVVHQAYIVTELYPLPVSIKGFLLTEMRKLPWGCLTYIGRDPIPQQYFINAGIVPEFAKIRLIAPE